MGEFSNGVIIYKRSVCVWTASKQSRGRVVAAMLESDKTVDVAIEDNNK